VREGSEEYLNSEKYETWERELDGPLLPTIRRLNEIRRENPALQHLRNVKFLDTHNDAIVAYAKRVPGNTIITAVSLDPFGIQEGSAVVPADLGLPPVFPVEDQFTGEHFDWRIGGNYVRFEAGRRQAHVLRVAA
jgi:starch synthase (maltosyl-transferring)